MASIRKGDTPHIITSKELIRRQHALPLFFYSIKDRVYSLTQKTNFLDSLLVVFAFIALISGFPFYPILFVILIVLALFVATLYHPFLGLVFLLCFTFPVLVFQIAVIAWIFLFIVVIALVFGYMHYRTMLFSFITLALSFSYLGFLLTIPTFIFGVLIIGRKRAAIMAIVLVLGIVAFSALTGLPNTGYIVSNSAIHQLLYSNVQHSISSSNSNTLSSSSSATNPSIFKYLTPVAPAQALLGLSKQIANSTGKSIIGLRNATNASQAASSFANTSLLGFGVSFDKGLLNFGNQSTISAIPAVLGLSVDSFTINPIPYILQLAALIGIILIIDEYVATTRSRHKGTESSIIAIGYPMSYILISTYYGFSITNIPLLMASTAIAPILIYILELNGINVAKALDVRKQDVRMKFGEAFEDIQAGVANESFSNIGNYENVKAELKEAILDPIEQRGISMAYNIKPVKGILFFGPPGTGKTMMMRALANEIHGAFYYVKTSELISKFPGDTEKMITNIFSIARKHQPCIIFFDEIDAIAMSRDDSNMDPTHRGALSMLLSEIDGFNKLDKIIVVGATNIPNVLDKAIMRPGRFDKSIYLPLPNLDGRKKILKIYLEKLPIDKNIDINQIAIKSERFSGADIKALCNTIAQEVAKSAITKHHVLSITQQDILQAIASTKPSTSLSQIEQYRSFKIEFERAIHGEIESESKKENVTMDMVIGMKEVKKALLTAIQIPIIHPDLATKYKVKPIKGILMFGPPGNGKTMLMRAAINDDSMGGATMQEISGSELANMGYSHAAATIKEIFNKAKENSPSIIFIDEIDAIAPARNNASEQGIAITTELLLEMDGIEDSTGILIVAATNRPNAMDPALLRSGRFDKLIFIKPPSASEREEIFKIHLNDVPIYDLDYIQLAKITNGFTAADIVNICREAKASAMQQEISSGEESKITMQQLTDLIKNTRPSAPIQLVEEYLTFLAKYGQR